MWVMMWRALLLVPLVPKRLLISYLVMSVVYKQRPLPLQRRGQFFIVFYMSLDQSLNTSVILITSSNYSTPLVQVDVVCWFANPIFQIHVLRMFSSSLHSAKLWPDIHMPYDKISMVFFSILSWINTFCMTLLLLLKMGVDLFYGYLRHVQPTSHHRKQEHPKLGSVFEHLLESGSSDITVKEIFIHLKNELASYPRRWYWKKVQLILNRIGRHGIVWNSSIMIELNPLVVIWAKQYCPFTKYPIHWIHHRYMVRHRICSSLDIRLSKAFFYVLYLTRESATTSLWLHLVSHRV